MNPDRWVKVWFTDEGWVLCPEYEEPRIDAAVSAYIDSGRSRDSLIHLTALDGGRIVVRASFVSGWSTSDPEMRRAAWEHRAAFEAEDRENKAAVGIFGDDD
jgi:hypothetical protein